MLKPWLHKTTIEAGCDEAGRGCLAGPVCAAAVILPKKFRNEILNDSKQLTEKQRNQLRIIIENEAVAWAVTMLDNTIIDEINILNASIRAMQESVGKLSIKPEMLLIDGNRFKPYENIPYECIIKGDEKFMSIAAASILAKTHRDEYMTNLHATLPVYNWAQNKGYPTREHKNAIYRYGITDYHRISYNLGAQLKIEL